MMVHACNGSMLGGETGGSQVGAQGQPEQHNEFRDSQGCLVRPYLKANKQTNSTSTHKWHSLCGVWAMLVLVMTVDEEKQFHVGFSCCVDRNKPLRAK